MYTRLPLCLPCPNQDSIAHIQFHLEKEDSKIYSEFQFQEDFKNLKQNRLFHIYGKMVKIVWEQFLSTSFTFCF